MKCLLRLVFFTLFMAGHLFAQAKQNIDMFYSLCDSLASNYTAASYNLYLPGDFVVFKSRLESRLNKNAARLPHDTGASGPLSITVDDARTEYTESYRDGFFGEYKVVRKISLSGNVLRSAGTAADETRHFSFSVQDTISYDYIKKAENPSLPLTKAALPAEPFFSSLVEPVIAVASAATAVILFFTIRSK